MLIPSQRAEGIPTSISVAFSTTIVTMMWLWCIGLPISSSYNASAFTCGAISTQIFPMSEDNGNRPDRLRTFQPDEQLPPARTATPLGATFSILLTLWCNLRRLTFAAESTAAQVPESAPTILWLLTFLQCHFASALQRFLCLNDSLTCSFNQSRSIRSYQVADPCLQKKSAAG